MFWTRRLFFAVMLVCLALPSVARAAESDYHHVHLMAPDAKAAAAWYMEHMGCEAYEREGACRYGQVQVGFIEREPEGGSVGTAVDHIGLSFEDLGAKMAGWKASGLNVLEDVREIDGLFKLAFLEDPWGTKIEAVEDHEDLGLHHLHLRSNDPDATLAWYHDVFGGVRDAMKGRLDGLRWGRVWLPCRSTKERSWCRCRTARSTTWDGAWLTSTRLGARSRRRASSSLASLGRLRPARVRT